MVKGLRGSCIAYFVYCFHSVAGNSTSTNNGSGSAARWDTYSKVGVGLGSGLAFALLVVTINFVRTQRAAAANDADTAPQKAGEGAPLLQS